MSFKAADCWGDFFKLNTAPKKKKKLLRKTGIGRVIIPEENKVHQVLTHGHLATALAASSVKVRPNSTE